MVKVILDRSVFHGDRFLALRDSNLSSLVNTATIQLMYTAEFLEETFLYYQRSPESFTEHWSFIHSLNHKFWFKHPDFIVPVELGEKARDQLFYLQRQDDIERVLRSTNRLEQGKIFVLQLRDAFLKTRVNRIYRSDFRRRILDSRKFGVPNGVDFSKYYEQNVERAIQEAIVSHYKNSHNFLTVWRTQRDRCPFTDMFLRSWFSAIYLPLSDHQSAVDENDRFDAEQLAFLIWADIFVSDDTKFMRNSFELLYSDSSKLFLSSAQFIQFLKTFNEESPLGARLTSRST